MPHIAERDPNRWPGRHKEYALFVRPLGNRDPMAWKLLGRPTANHDELRDIAMPQEMIDSNLYGIGWVDNYSGFELKIMECTVDRSQWRDEAKQK